MLNQWTARGGLDLEEALASIVDWYRELRSGADMRAVTVGQIEAFSMTSEHH